MDTIESDKTWDSSKLSNCLDKFFTTTVGVGMNLLKYRHIAIAIVSKYLDANIVVIEGGKVNDERAEDDGDNIWDLQAGHKTSTALNIYARMIGENILSNQSTIDKYRNISCSWHDFLFPESKIQSPTAMLDSLSTKLHELQVQRFV
jgi:hypothetical protein